MLITVCASFTMLTILFCLLGMHLDEIRVELKRIADALEIRGKGEKAEEVKRG